MARQEEGMYGILTVLFVYIFGDDRLRQRDSSVCLFLFGMAPVPVTHMVQPLIAENSVIGKAVAKMKFNFAPSMVLAA